jgi:hypothetical protein
LYGSTARFMRSGYSGVTTHPSADAPNRAPARPGRATAFGWFM